MTIADVCGLTIARAGNSKGKAGMAGIEAMAGVSTTILVTMTMMMISAVALEEDHVSIGGVPANGFRLDAASAADAALTAVIV